MLLVVAALVLHVGRVTEKVLPAAVPRAVREIGQLNVFMLLECNSVAGAHA